MKNWHARQLRVTSRKVCNMQAITRRQGDLKTTALDTANVSAKSRPMSICICCVRDEGCEEQRL